MGKYIILFWFALLVVTVPPQAFALSYQEGNWPKSIGSTVYYSPIITNVDGGSDKEIVIGAYYGSVHVLNSAGNESNGWPRSNGGEATSPAVWNLDGGGNEIIWASSLSQHCENCPPYAYGYVNAWHYDGTQYWTPYTISEYPVKSSPSVGDLDGDGSYEVVAGSGGGNVYALNSTGDLNWSRTIGGNILSTPALGDLNGDGKLDVVIGSGGTLYALDGGNNGEELWNVSVGSLGYESPVIGDINFDGKLEVVVCSSSGLSVISDNGVELWFNGSIKCRYPALGDLDRDGNLEIVVGTYDYPGKVYALRGDESEMWSYQLRGTSSSAYERVVSSPAIADFDGNGYPEVVVATVITSGSLGSGKLYVFEYDGSEVKDSADIGNLASTIIAPSPAIADLDGDGDLEIAVVSIDGTVHVFDEPSSGDYIPWAMFQHDARHTGLYDQPLLKFLSPTNGSTYNESDVIGFNAQGYTVSGSEPSFVWNSSIDGLLSEGSSFTRSCLSVGTHTITLTASDGGGRSTSFSRTISITDVPPIATINSPSKSVFQENEPVFFNGSGDDPCGIDKYEWDFDGNGTYEWSNSNTGDTFHVYYTAGNYTARFRVTDDDGATDTTEVSLEINSPPSTPPTTSSDSDNQKVVIKDEFELILSAAPTMDFYAAPPDLTPVLTGPLLVLGDLPLPPEKVLEMNMLTRKRIGILEGDVYTILSEQVLKRYKNSQKVVIARGDLEVDSLASVAFARALGIPILLVEPGKIPLVTRSAMEELGVRSAIIVGGPVAVSEEVAQMLPEVERIWGQNREETAVKIAEALMAQQSVNTVVVTDGQNPNPLAAIAAVQYNAPILYVSGEEVSSVTSTFLQRYKLMRIVTIGTSEKATSKLNALLLGGIR